jgi:hypothetical protein
MISVHAVGGYINSVDPEFDQMRDVPAAYSLILERINETNGFCWKAPKVIIPNAAEEELFAIIAVEELCTLIICEFST